MINTFYISNKGGSFIFPISTKYIAECSTKDLRCIKSGNGGYCVIINPNKSEDSSRTLSVTFKYPYKKDIVLNIVLSGKEITGNSNTNIYLNKNSEYVVSSSYSPSISENGGVITVTANAPGECVDDGHCFVQQYLNVYSITVPKTSYRKKYIVKFNICGLEKLVTINGDAAEVKDPTLNLEYTKNVSNTTTNITIKVTTSYVKSLLYTVLDGTSTCEKINDTSYKLSFKANTTSSVDLIKKIKFTATGFTGKILTETAIITLAKFIPIIPQITKIAFFGATNILPNNSDEITKHQNITLNAQQHTTSMISNKNNFLFTAVPKNYYKVVNWKDDIGTSIFDYFSNPEATICFVLPVNITSEKFSLNEEPYEVYITGRQDKHLNQTSHTATISKK